MLPLKQAIFKTAAPVLITVSLGFAGAAFAASGSEYGSKSGSATQGETTNQSAGTPSETMPMSPECKKDPTDPKCAEHEHSPSGMSGSESGSAAGNEGSATDKGSPHHKVPPMNMAPKPETSK